MCDQTNPYNLGDKVWVLLLNHVWWPGIVVDKSTTPESYQEFIKKKKIICVVGFLSEASMYEGVVNINKIAMYNCNRKLEFLKKGYLLYKKQLKSNKEKLYFNMTHFVADVKSFEKEIGGDENIFEQFEEKEDEKPLKININELFTTEKSRKTKARKSGTVRGRPSLPATKISAPLPNKIKPSTPKAKPKPSTTTSNTSATKSYFCYFGEQNRCTFNTTRFDILKRHIADHKAKAELMKQSATSSNNLNTNTQLSSPTSTKRNYGRNRKSCTKKIKLHDELLKDWDFDEAEDANKDGDKNNLDTNTVEKDEEKDEDKKAFDTNTIEGGKENDLDKSTTEDDKSKNTSEVNNVVENIPQETSGFLDKDVEEDIPSLSKSNENISGGVFDFEEDDSSNIISDLRPSKSDFNSTIVGEMNDSIGRKCDQEFITSTILGSQLHVNDSETGHTNDFENEIESSKLLLKKTVNTLDQISDLEKSMNNISSNKSKLIGDNQSSESLIENTYLDKDITNPENETMVKNNVKADDLITSPVEIPQSNDNEESNYMGIDDENKKLCSNVDGAQIQNIGAEGVVDPTENGRYECLLDGLPSPDWIKEDSWDSFSQNGLQEALELLTIDTHHNMDFMDLESLKPNLVDTPTEPTVVHKIKDYGKHKKNVQKKRIVVRVPMREPDLLNVKTDEELLASPEFRRLMELDKCVGANALNISFIDGAFILKEE
ncbi:uncharacterized protein LOC112681924 isoform X1 [Sipha flava]|uniref:Uncharacterized protein LOC112681924 isoform X1 n=2 Tax=Sipha flava TaxID=143950 RepID=A0A8B8FB38_9HEMI|nr:uncharacterized protein LOC112681924 isoform X1 [Sipha flava]XP_025408074.1 uncharacterized protein LOC112681924 isoform X1 [Sipha flava]